MKIILHSFFIISLFISICFNGCSTTDSNSGNITLKGYVLDTTKSPYVKITGANVVLKQTETTLTAVTDSTGTFTFTGISSGDYDISISKFNYYILKKSFNVPAEDTLTTITFSMLPKSIYTYDNIILDEYMNETSFSAANLLGGYRVQDNTNDKDIQMRDSVIGTDTFVYIRNSDMDINYHGYTTYFSNSIVQQYTKVQFDTLSKFPTVDGTLNTVRDFPNTQFVDKLFSIGVKHNVCAFYLAGRWMGDPYPRTFGLLYIDSVWVDNAKNIRRMLVDIKINTNALNDFNPTPSK